MVIGIDMSNILDQAEKIVRSNGFTEDRKSFTRASRSATEASALRWIARAGCSAVLVGDCAGGFVERELINQKSCY